MKKLISLILVLALALSAVSALAATISPRLEAINFGDSTTTTPGIAVGSVPQESVDLVNKLYEGGDLNEEVYNNTTFVGSHGDPVEGPAGPFENIIISPMPAINVDPGTYDPEEDDEANGEFIVPIPAYVAEYLQANLDKVIALFTYQVTNEDETTEFFTYQVDFEIEKTSENTYGLKYIIPVDILQAAEEWPSFMSFELVNDAE